MRLLDAADVQVSEGNWMVGYEAKARECDVNVYLSDACAVEDSQIITGEDDSVYFVAPFAINAELFSGTSCYREDAPTWLKGALKDVNERALGRSFIMQATGDAQTWLGGMREAPLPADPDNATDADWVAAISGAREMWTSSVIGEAPLMHVAPDHVPKLIQLGVLTTTGDGDLVSVWGDVVVSSTGYSNPFPTGDPRVVPWLWFTGPIKIYLTPVDTSGLILNAQQNHTMVQANEIAAVDFAPCAAVRLGPIDPSLVLLPITVVRTGQTVTVTAPNATGAVTYDWGDGSTDTVAPNGTTPTTHYYATLGAYTITATDVGGASSTEPVPVDVTFSVHNMGGLKAQLSTNQAPHFCYDFGAAGGQACASAGAGPIFTYPAPGTYTVSLLSSGSGQTPTAGAALKTQQLVVTGLKVAGTHVALKLDATAQFSTGAVTYDWGDGTFTTAANGTATTSHTYAAAGTYTVRATDSTGAWGEQSFPITAAPASLLTSYWYNGGMAGRNMSGLGAQQTFVWGDGTQDFLPPFQNNAAYAHTYAGPGTYSAKVIDSSGAEAPQSIIVSASSPTIVDVSPPDVLPGSPDTVLTINGTGFNNPKVLVFTTGNTNIKDIQLVTTPVSPTQLTAVLPVSQFTVTPGVPYALALVVQNADGTRSGRLIFQITDGGGLAATAEESPVDESAMPLEDFPVDTYPIVAEVEPEEKPKPKPKSPAAEQPAKKAVPQPPAKKAQPKQEKE